MRTTLTPVLPRAVRTTLRAVRHSGPSRAPAAALRGWQPHCACGGGCPRCVPTTGDQALPRTLERRLAQHLGADLTGVRLHTGPAAARAVASVGARRAFASGEHIVVGERGFSPASAAGRQLIAHEAVHVVQQRGGPVGGVPDTPSLEREAQRSADAFEAGRTAPPPRRASAPAGLVQRDEPAPGANAGTGTSTLQLDPELQAEIYFARWLAQHAQPGGASAGAPDPGTEPAPRLWVSPTRMGAETLDFGSLLTPYFQRGLRPTASGDTRDLALVSSLFNERYRLVRALPDLRAMAPTFVRPWIPGNWRVQLAATLTSTTIDFALGRDNPTFIDLSNQAFERFTGATTYSLPMLPVPLVNDWWDRFSGGGR